MSQSIRVLLIGDDSLELGISWATAFNLSPHAWG